MRNRDYPRARQSRKVSRAFYFFFDVLVDVCIKMFIEFKPTSKTNTYLLKVVARIGTDRSNVLVCHAAPTAQKSRNPALI
jgi:hypothetical protein